MITREIENIYEHTAYQNLQNAAKPVLNNFLAIKEVKFVVKNFSQRKSQV